MTLSFVGDDGQLEKVGVSRPTDHVAVGRGPWAVGRQALCVTTTHQPTDRPPGRHHTPNSNSNSIVILCIYYLQYSFSYLEKGNLSDAVFNNCVGAAETEKLKPETCGSFVPRGWMVSDVSSGTVSGDEKNLCL